MDEAEGQGTDARAALHERERLTLLLSFVLVSFAANSLITRYVGQQDLLDAGLLSGFRFIFGALALVLLSVGRRRPAVGRANVLPAVWLGTYAACISYGYRFIGAAAGTFVFYATVLITLMLYDLVVRSVFEQRRAIGALVSLVGVLVLAAGSIDTVTPRGVVLLAATGVAWGLYTAAGRGVGDPEVATTGNFLLLAVVFLVPTGVGVAAGLTTTVAGLAWAAVMGAGTTAIAYVAWYACQRHLSGTAAGSAQLVIPVLTTAGAVVLLGESLSVRLLIAAVLVAAGMWLGRPRAQVSTQVREPRPASPDPLAAEDT